MRTPIPLKKKVPDRKVSRLRGNRYAAASLLRFHSSLALRRSSGDLGVPNRGIEAIREIMPATVSITPTSWIRKRFGIPGFYQRES
jgi:hypothetical protein